MICKFCNREIEDDSIFCRFCGEKVVRTRKKKDEIKVPEPKQLPSGSWFARVMVRGNSVCITEATKEAYYIKARAVKSGLLETAPQLPKMPLSKAIDNYINENTNVLSPSTIKAYKSIRKTRFQALMDKDINSIKWQEAVNTEATDVSPKTLANAWRLITASLKAAGVTPPEVKLPKIPKAQKEWLDFEQIQAFTKIIKGQDCELGALLALHGLRRSELLALTKDSIDLKKQTITISGAVVYNDKSEIVHKDTNKNASSQRTVPILIPRLEELLNDDNIKGQLITTKPNTLYVQVNKLCKRNQLPEIGVHGLRHSFCSLAFHLGWSEATVMTVGGWSDSKTVHNIYKHLAEKDKNADIKKMISFYS